MRGKAIAIIRAILYKFGRAEIKQLLLLAGADSGRILDIPTIYNMKSSQYKSKEEIISLGFDTIDKDFGPDEADGVRIELIRQMKRKKPALFEADGNNQMQDLADALTNNGYNLAKILGGNAAADLGEVLLEKVEMANMHEARDLAVKTLRRITTDPSGAVTAVVSCLESVYKAILKRLGKDLPAEQTLPKLLVKIRRDTNLECLFQGEKGKIVLSSLSTLTENVYQLAHEVGDRHGLDEGCRFANPSVMSLMVCCCTSLAVLLIDALHEGELKTL